MTCTAHTTERRPCRTDGSPLGAVEAAFQLLADGPRPLVFHTAGLGCEPAGREIPVTELRTVLLRSGLGREEQDIIWRELVRLARAGDPAWTVACAGLALPGLRRIAGGLTRGYEGDRDDIDAEILAGFVAALGTIDLGWTRIAFRLLTRARRAGIRARRANRVLGRPLMDTDRPVVATASGHPDQVLQAAVVRGVITAEEAEVIGETRLGDAGVRELAVRLGVEYKTLLQRRRRAERRLAAAITRGDLAEPVRGASHSGSPGNELVLAAVAEIRAA